MQVTQPVKVVRGGNVRFGTMEDKGGMCAIILPKFSTARCRLIPLTRAIENINNSPKMNQDSLCEKEIRKSMGDIGTQIIWSGGNLIALTQQAATALFSLGLKMTKDKYFIPV
ncbi:MAG: hypothetical protein WC774_00610 [Candidatus Gracilibacteria bacterium]